MQMVLRNKGRKLTDVLIQGKEYNQRKMYSKTSQAEE